MTEITDRNRMISYLQDLLGSEGSREIAASLFDVLRADDRIYWNNQGGLVLRDDVDPAEVAVSAGLI